MPCASSGCQPASSCQNRRTAAPLPPACVPAGYLTLKEVFSYGALMSVVNLCVWGVVGGAWWKFMGFF